VTAADVDEAATVMAKVAERIRADQGR